jgi:hypothetical protein
MEVQSIRIHGIILNIYQDKTQAILSQAKSLMELISIKNDYIQLLTI